MHRFTAGRFVARRSQSAISTSSRALLLGTIATALVFGLMHQPHLQAQTASQQTPALRFDVVSLKTTADQRYFEVTPKRSPGRFTWTTQGWGLIEYAYGVQAWQISGDTGRLATIYQIEATASPSVTEDEERQMVQALLADRFKAVTHRSTKMGDGYILAQGKSGPQMLEAKGAEAPPLPDAFRNLCGHPPRVQDLVSAVVLKPDLAAITGCGATMSELTKRLEQVLGIAVLDQTNLEGKYYFRFEYAVDADPGVSAPDLPNAINALGLKLAKYRGPVQTLIIDHFEETPIPN